MLQRTGTPQKAAADFARCARLGFRVPPYLCHLTEICDGLKLHWISVGQVDPDRVILYLHGGAYLSGSGDTHCALVGRLSRLSGLRACVPDYRLLQDAPFPAAFQDACAAWDMLRARGYAPRDIVLGGDSAGGGLMLALLSHLTRRGEVPASAFALSPWTDLTMSGATLGCETEALLPIDRMTEVVDLYLEGADRKDPRASPLFARFNAPPPVLIQVGAQEALADDARRMTRALQKAGGAVTLREWPTALHVFQILDGWLPESRIALSEVARFIQVSFDNARR